MNQNGDGWDEAYQRLVLAYREWKKRHSGSQAAFAEAVGVTQATVSQWLNPEVRQRPEAVQMLRIPGALGISERWFLTGQGDMSPEGGGGSALYYRGGQAALLAAEESLRKVTSQWQNEADRELRAGAEAARRRAAATHRAEPRKRRGSA